MLNITQDIQSLTSFKNDTAKFIANLKKSGRPSILTVNGKAEIVVMDAAAYQKIQKKLEFDQTVDEINRGLEDFENGKFSPAEEVFEELQKIIDKAKSEAHTKIKTKKNNTTKKL
ncbi:MAG: type II toxin-antitoxin system Phd/YefM family antitoxin [Pseudomonadota bacterium]